jgi:hypothetical protein
MVDPEVTMGFTTNSWSKTGWFGVPPWRNRGSVPGCWVSCGLSFGHPKEDLGDAQVLTMFFFSVLSFDFPRDIPYVFAHGYWLLIGC